MILQNIGVVLIFGTFRWCTSRQEPLSIKRPAFQRGLTVWTELIHVNPKIISEPQTGRWEGVVTLDVPAARTDVSVSVPSQ